MALDFSIIIRVRQAFGDQDEDLRELNAEREAPFVGASKPFSFKCENVNRSQEAIIQFQSFGVSHRKNSIKINGFDIFGGIPTSVDGFTPPGFPATITRPTWNSVTLIVQPNILQENNILLIAAKNSDGGDGGNIDNFILDNFVIFFKTGQTNTTRPKENFLLKKQKQTL